jgi:hypothetical protein
VLETCNHQVCCSFFSHPVTVLCSYSDFNFNVLQPPESEIKSTVEALEYLQHDGVRSTATSWSLAYLLLSGAVNVTLPDLPA